MTALVIAALLAAEPMVDGVVKEVVEHGAFVAFGNNNLGFLHVDDMGWSREADPSKLVKPGQKVKVRVVRQSDPKRPSLVMKRDEDHPWVGAPAKYRVGTKHRAKVVSLPESGIGVFFELEPWVEVLVHHTELPHGKTAADFALGQVVTLKVKNVDAEKRRVGGSMR